MALEPKPRPTAIDFVVRYPWGTNYCGKLRAALRKLGVPTMHDAFNDGSDSDGFFFSNDRRRLLAAQRLIHDYNRYLDADGKDRFDDIIATLYSGQIYEVLQDWKWLGWEVDAVRLALVGVQLKMLTTRMTPHGEEMTFRVSRRAERRRARRA